ncbi:MAG: hypothetical protein AAF514_12790, partial [Verrucomicrobiota bacterium]
LSGAQRVALRRWVRAGGALVLVPDRGLSPETLAFLNRLTDSPSPITGDAEGKLTFVEPFRLDPCGIGRLALIDPQFDFEPEVVEDRTGNEDILKLLKFLWSTITPEDLDLDNDALLQNGRRNWVGNGQTIRMDPAAMTESLMPEGVQVVPLKTLLFLFLAFLLVIGPIDYFILGWIKKRFLTWLFFTVAAFAFTGLTIFLTEKHLNTQTAGGTLTIIDLDRDNRALRRNEFTLVFPSRTGKATRPGSGLLGPWGRGRSVSSFGAYPGDYRIEEDLRQWKPALYRRFSIPVEEEEEPLLTELDWESLKRIKEQWEGDIDALFNHLEEWVPAEAGYFIARRNGRFRFSHRRAEMRWCSNSFSYNGVPGRFFAPGGGPMVTDLPIIGRLGPDEFQIDILISNGNQHTLYRRFL